MAKICNCLLPELKMRRKPEYSKNSLFEFALNKILSRFHHNNFFIYNNYKSKHSYNTYLYCVCTSTGMRCIVKSILFDLS